MKGVYILGTLTGQILNPFLCSLFHFKYSCSVTRQSLWGHKNCRHNNSKIMGKMQFNTFIWNINLQHPSQNFYYYYKNSLKQFYMKCSIRLSVISVLNMFNVICIISAVKSTDQWRYEEVVIILNQPDISWSCKVTSNRKWVVLCVQTFPIHDYPFRFLMQITIRQYYRKPQSLCATNNLYWPVIISLETTWLGQHSALIQR